MKQKWVISCEHGGNLIPATYAPFFNEAEAVLQTHRGYDPGALELFQLLAGELADFSQYSRTSRLLVELNRSLHHKNLFSSFTKPTPPSTKEKIINDYYLPYRQLVEEKIRSFLSEGESVTHISVHSFTPELDGKERNADIGLLYDPARPEEKIFCEQWKKELKNVVPSAMVRLNYPYKGKADGFTTYLRKRFPEGYKGIELEVSQKLIMEHSLQHSILESLRQLKRN